MTDALFSDSCPTRPAVLSSRIVSSTLYCLQMSHRRPLSTKPDSLLYDISVGKESPFCENTMTSYTLRYGKLFNLFCTQPDLPLFCGHAISIGKWFPMHFIQNNSMKVHESIWKYLKVLRKGEYSSKSGEVFLFISNSRWMIYEIKLSRMI